MLIWFQSSIGSTLDDTIEYLKALKHPCQVSLFQLLLTFSLLSLSLSMVIDISFGYADFVCVSWNLDDVYRWRSSVHAKYHICNQLESKPHKFPNFYWLCKCNQCQDLPWEWWACLTQQALTWCQFLHPVFIHYPQQQQECIWFLDQFFQSLKCKCLSLPHKHRLQTLLHPLCLHNLIQK